MQKCICIAAKSRRVSAFILCNSTKHHRWGVCNARAAAVTYRVASLLFYMKLFLHHFRNNVLTVRSSKCVIVLLDGFAF